jgi:hypothetical protein
LDQVKDWISELEVKGTGKEHSDKIREKNQESTNET